MVSASVSTDTLYPLADAFVRSFAPNKNYGAEDTLAIRSVSTNASRYWSYLRFDGAAIETQVGGGELDSAHLQLTIKELGGWGTAGGWLDIHRVPASWAPGGWTEYGVTWNCPLETDTTDAGLDCPAGVWDTTGFGGMTPTDQVLIKNSTTGVVTFDVTADVAAFLADTANHGWVLTKPSNNNNQKIILRSRERPEKPRLVLYVSADTSYRLGRLIESSVAATLSHPDTLLAPGTVVSYSIAAAPNHENVQVTVDGQLVPATGTIVMSQPHTLVASADRIVAVPVVDQPLVQSTRNVLLSADPVTAFKAYLDDVMTLVESTTPEDAEARLDAIHFLAYDPFRIRRRSGLSTVRWAARCSP
jgi:hypothetical protein